MLTVLWLLTLTPHLPLWLPAIWIGCPRTLGDGDVPSPRAMVCSCWVALLSAELREAISTGHSHASALLQPAQCKQEITQLQVPLRKGDRTLGQADKAVSKTFSAFQLQLGIRQSLQQQDTLEPSEQAWAPSLELSAALGKLLNRYLEKSKWGE